MLALETAEIRTSASAPSDPDPTVPGPDPSDYEIEGYDEELEDEGIDIMDEDPIFCPWYVNNDYHEQTNQEKFEYCKLYE